LDSKILIKTSAARLFCGLVSFVIISHMLFFAYQEVLDRNVQNNLEPELKVPAPYRQKISKADSNYINTAMDKRIELFLPIIIDAAEKYNVDPDLVQAIIMAESSYNPLAVSNKGAVGLMQIMPATATSLGVENLYDPADNVNGGVKYLKWLLNQFEGDTRLAVAAYNAGRTNVQKYQGVPPYKDTQYYVKKVFEYYEYYQGNINVEI
jgi:soluble lytic murein transglycosylase-like protein